MVGDSDEYAYYQASSPDYRLDELQIRLDASSRAEVMRRALALLDYATRAAMDGGELLVRAPSGKEKSLLVL